jgi:hypothetical protein
MGEDHLPSAGRVQPPDAGLGDPFGQDHSSYFSKGSRLFSNHGCFFVYQERSGGRGSVTYPFPDQRRGAGVELEKAESENEGEQCGRLVAPVRALRVVGGSDNA